MPSLTTLAWHVLVLCLTDTAPRNVIMRLNKSIFHDSILCWEDYLEKFASFVIEMRIFAVYVFLVVVVVLGLIGMVDIPEYFTLIVNDKDTLPWKKALKLPHILLEI